jgi:hypothetical protein
VLRRLVYLGIKELSGIAEDVIIVTSSLTKDMTGKEDCYRQGCGSGLIYYGSGSSIFAQSGSKLKQNFRKQFLSQIFLKSKFESNQIKNAGTCVIHKIFFKKYVVSAILYLFSGKIFVKNN